MSYFVACSDAEFRDHVISYYRRVLAHNEAQLAHRLSIWPNIFELYRNRFANQQGATTARRSSSSSSATNSNEWRIALMKELEQKYGASFAIGRQTAEHPRQTPTTAVSTTVDAAGSTIMNRAEGGGKGAALSSLALPVMMMAERDDAQQQQQPQKQQERTAAAVSSPSLTSHAAVETSGGGGGGVASHPWLKPDHQGANSTKVGHPLPQKAMPLPPRRPHRCGCAVSLSWALEVPLPQCCELLPRPHRATPPPNHSSLRPTPIQSEVQRRRQRDAKKPTRPDR